MAKRMWTVLHIIEFRCFQYTILLMLQHTVRKLGHCNSTTYSANTFWIIVRFQSFLRKTVLCSSMTVTHKLIHVLTRLVWRNTRGFNRALTSTLLNTYGMTWNIDCKPGLLLQHQYLSLQMLLWLNWHKFPQTLEETQDLEETFWKSGGCRSCKGSWGQFLY